jgi:hypothetical protein
VIATYYAKTHSGKGIQKGWAKSAVRKFVEKGISLFGFSLPGSHDMARF